MEEDEIGEVEVGIVGGEWVKEEGKGGLGIL